MKKLLVFPILLSCALLGSCSKQESNTSNQQQSQTQQTAPPQKQVTIPAFDGERAYTALLAQTNFGPRNIGSAGHKQCLEFLHSELKKYADTVWLQPFSQKGYDNEILEMNNIFASFQPKAQKRILLLAHWDTRPRADQDRVPAKRTQPILGANDGASGVAVLLEIARLLKTTPPSVGVDILFVDGEDYGREGDNHNYLLGSRYFASNLPKNYSPAFGILLDMVGDSQLEIKKERLSLQYAPDVVELVWSAAYELGVPQFTSAIEVGIGADDHIPLNLAGIKTIDIIDFSYPSPGVNYWHTTEDTPDKCSPESLSAVGKVVMKVIYTQ